MKINEIRFQGLIPSIGYTDGINIYTSYSVVGKDLKVLRKHEMSHIWLNHYNRTLEKKNLNNSVWNAALDHEIAKHLYSDEDNIRINSFRSPLYGGVKTSDCDKYPNCTYAEEFYDELIKEDKNKDYKFISLNANDIDEVLDEEKEIDISLNKKKEIKELIEKAKKNILLDTLKDSEKTQALNFKIAPSLGSLIDSYLGRQKRVRVRSYKGQSPIEERDTSILKKGYISKRKTPLISIYIDRSGSFSEDKTKKVNQKLNEVLLKYRASISKDVLFFNTKLMLQDPLQGSGGTDYNCVLKDIKKNNATLSIIMTDSDQCTLLDYGKLPEILVIAIDTSKTWLASQLKVKEIN